MLALQLDGWYGCTYSIGYVFFPPKIYTVEILLCGGNIDET